MELDKWLRSMRGVGYVVKWDGVWGWGGLGGGGYGYEGKFPPR